MEDQRKEKAKLKIDCCFMLIMLEGDPCSFQVSIYVYIYVMHAGLKLTISLVNLGKTC